MYRKLLTRIIEDESGATSIEYGFIAVLVSLAAIGVLTTLGTTLGGLFTLVTATVTAGVGG